MIFIDIKKTHSPDLILFCYDHCLGAGPTPFCRGFDGRAVVRSSVREFLVSEGTHHFIINVPQDSSLSRIANHFYF